MDLLFTLIISIVCLILEGFFSGSEIAIVNADRMKLRRDSDRGSKSAKLALKLIEAPTRFFTATLIGTNVSTVTASVAITLYIINNFGEVYAPLAILWWPIMLIGGEIVPKSLYQHHANEIVLKIAPILMFWSYLTYPFGWIFNKFSSKIINILRRKTNIEPNLSRQELEQVLENGAGAKSDVKLDERVMISRIFDLADKRIENIMTPLVDVDSIPSTSNRVETEQMMEEYEFSRLPVYKNDAYNIIGIVSCSDLLFKDPKLPLEKLIQPAFYVPEEMPLDELLKAMKKNGKAMAIVVDEYGAAVGIVTMEDLLEEIVGDIKDEHDETLIPYKMVRANHYLIEGRMEIEEANARLGLNVPLGDYETIAGFVIHEMEHIPKEGERFESNGWLYIIEKATPRAIIEVEAKKK